ncbi:MAG: ATP-binding protein [Candidatus Promineifilaceae bacterium]
MEQKDAGDVIRLDIPASYTYLKLLGVCVRTFLDIAEEQTELNGLAYNVELAVHEACTNIVEHAYAGVPGRIEIILSLVREPRRLVVELHDSGRSFKLPEVKQPDFNEPQINGYGLFLIYQLMDEIKYHPQSGDNHWYLVKNL